MSLAATLLIGSSAFALDNVNVSGNAQLFYYTDDAAEGTSLFNKNSSAADAALHLGVTADLIEHFKAGASATALSSLGLENNVVGKVWGGAHTASTGTGSSYENGTKVEDAAWLGEAWIAATAGNTTLKVGRMEIDSPLGFTETWSIERNTFEAAVLSNTDIPDTTLIAAYVGNGNGTETFGQNLNSNVNQAGLAVAPVVNENGKFTTYGTDGAYGFGIINNSLDVLSLQAWYYDVTDLALATWVQADLNLNGFLVGAQHSWISIDEKFAASAPSSTVYALMLGYEIKDAVTAKIAYSSVGKDTAAGYNAATAVSTAQSKLYTEARWAFGKVTAADTSAMNLTVEAPVSDIVDLGFYATVTDDASAADVDMREIALSASRSFGRVDTKLAYINTDLTENKTNAAEPALNYNILQAYLTVNF